MKSLRQLAAAILCLALGLPNPVFAMRTLEPKESAPLLTKLTVGLEEKRFVSQDPVRSAALRDLLKGDSLTSSKVNEFIRAVLEPFQKEPIPQPGLLKPGAVYSHTFVHMDEPTVKAVRQFAQDAMDRSAIADEKVRDHARWVVDAFLDHPDDAVVPHKRLMDLSGNEAVEIVLELLRVATGVQDPYAQLKREYNQTALRYLTTMDEVVRTSGDPLRTAVGLGIVGNAIDFADAGQRERLQTAGFDMAAEIRKAESLTFTVDQRDQFLAALRESKSKELLFLVDNAGEIIFDLPLIRLLLHQGWNITLAGKSLPHANDMLAGELEELFKETEVLEYLGRDQVAKQIRVIASGTAMTGLDLRRATPELVKAWGRASVVYAKGQGMIETLRYADLSRDVFHAVMVKNPAYFREADEQGHPLPLHRGDVLFLHTAPAAGLEEVPLAEVAIRGSALQRPREPDDWRAAESAAIAELFERIKNYLPYFPARPGVPAGQMVKEAIIPKILNYAAESSRFFWGPHAYFARVDLRAFLRDGSLWIQVQDNAHELPEKVFVRPLPPKEIAALANEVSHLGWRLEGANRKDGIGVVWTLQIPLQERLLSGVEEKTYRVKAEELGALVRQARRILDSQERTGWLRKKAGEITSEVYFTEGGVAYLPASKGTLSVIGDVHGDMEALRRAVEAARYTPDDPQRPYLVFVGDYWDVGKRSLDTTLQVLRLFVQDPERIILLGGNHDRDRPTRESKDVQETIHHGWRWFFRELGENLGQSQGDALFNELTDFARRLPNLLVTRNGIAVIHAAPPSSDLDPRFDSSKGLLAISGNELLRDLLAWNPIAHPEEEDDRPNTTFRRMHEHLQMGQWIGQKGIDRFLDIIGAKILIRGHNRKGPLAPTHHEKVLTVITTDWRSEDHGYPMEDHIEARIARFDLGRTYSKVPFEAVLPLWSPGGLEEDERGVLLHQLALGKYEEAMKWIQSLPVAQGNSPPNFIFELAKRYHLGHVLVSDGSGDLLRKGDIILVHPNNVNGGGMYLGEVYKAHETRSLFGDSKEGWNVNMTHVCGLNGLRLSSMPLSFDSGSGILLATAEELAAHSTAGLEEPGYRPFFNADALPGRIADAVRAFVRQRRGEPDTKISIYNMAQEPPQGVVFTLEDQLTALKPWDQEIQEILTEIGIARGDWKLSVRQYPSPEVTPPMMLFNLSPAAFAGLEEEPPGQKPKSLEDILWLVGQAPRGGRGHRRFVKSAKGSGYARRGRGWVADGLRAVIGEIVQEHKELEPGATTIPFIFGQVNAKMQHLLGRVERAYVSSGLNSFIRRRVVLAGGIVEYDRSVVRDEHGKEVAPKGRYRWVAQVQESSVEPPAAGLEERRVRRVAVQDQVEEGVRVLTRSGFVYQVVDLDLVREFPQLAALEELSQGRIVIDRSTGLEETGRLVADLIARSPDVTRVNYYAPPASRRAFWFRQKARIARIAVELAAPAAQVFLWLRQILDHLRGPADEPLNDLRLQQIAAGLEELA